MSDGTQTTTGNPMKTIVPIVAAIVIGGAGVGYAVHEHSNAATLAEQNQQVSAQLNATNDQLSSLTSKVNAMQAQSDARAAVAAVANAATANRAGARRATYDPRFKKLQSQMDAMGKQVDDQRSDIDSTRTDLTNARTELTGSIAHTHDELVLLEKKGERSYMEFDLNKSKDYKREGPISVSLRKANVKGGYADLAVIIEDRNVSDKHVNLFQPAMFYQADGQQPVEVVINDITKDHIHGYVSAPKYRPSELAMATDANNAAAGSDQSAQPPQRQKLSISKNDTQQQ